MIFFDLCFHLFAYDFNIALKAQDFYLIVDILTAFIISITISKIFFT